MGQACEVLRGGHVRQREQHDENLMFKEPKEAEWARETDGQTDRQTENEGLGWQTQAGHPGSHRSCIYSKSLRKQLATLVEKSEVEGQLGPPKTKFCSQGSGPLSPTPCPAPALLCRGLRETKGPTTGNGRLRAP